MLRRFLDVYQPKPAPAVSFRDSLPGNDEPAPTLRVSSDRHVGRRGGAGAQAD